MDSAGYSAAVGRDLDNSVATFLAGVFPFSGVIPVFRAFPRIFGFFPIPHDFFCIFLDSADIFAIILAD